MEIVVIGAIRVLGSLPVLRWAFVGGLIAVFVDLSDLLWMNLLDLGGLGNYQQFDKIVDQVYQLTFLWVALHWTGAGAHGSRSGCSPIGCWASWRSS